MTKTVLLASITVIGLLAVALLAAQPGFVGSPAEVAAAQQVGAEYVGSDTCGVCHSNIYDLWKASGHAWKLTPVIDGQPPDYPFTEVPHPPEGYTWEDVSYIIGGYNWKARFIDQEGYIITNPPGPITDTTYLNQYNFANPAVGRDDGWVTYNSGTVNKPYDCGECHTTGYRPEGNQNGMPGIVGTWAETSIGCEECHGPGSNHVLNPYGVAMQVKRDAEECGVCHRRNEVEAVDASGGFIQHHEQYEELFQGKHAVLDCVQCHNPHVGVVQLRQAGELTTRTLCQNCHFQQAKHQQVASHAANEVVCIDCHMPRLVRSAWGNADMFTGDIRTHLMAIDPDQVEQFTEDGKIALSQISLNFACRHCHVEGGSAPALPDAMLQAAATGYHERQ